MSLLEKLEAKDGEKEVNERVKKEVEKEVAKLKEYEKLGFIGE